MCGRDVAALNAPLLPPLALLSTPACNAKFVTMPCHAMIKKITEYNKVLVNVIAVPSNIKDITVKIESVNMLIVLLFIQI